MVRRSNKVIKWKVNYSTKGKKNLFGRINLIVFQRSQWKWGSFINLQGIENFNIEDKTQDVR